MNVLEILGNVGFDWQVALANLVNFTILFFILRAILFKPLSKTLRERKEKIENGILNAQKAETSLLMAEEAYDSKIEDAKSEANVIIASAHKKEEEILKEAELKATVEGEKILSDTRDQIEKDKKRMEDEVTEKTADLVVLGIEKILREEIDQSKGEEIIKKLIASKA